LKGLQIEVRTRWFLVLTTYLHLLKLVAHRGGDRTGRVSEATSRQRLSCRTLVVLHAACPHHHKLARPVLPLFIRAHALIREFWLQCGSLNRLVCHGLILQVVSQIHPRIDQITTHLYILIRLIQQFLSPLTLTGTLLPTPLKLIRCSHPRHTLRYTLS